MLNREELMKKLEELDSEKLVDTHNTYCSHIGDGDNQIFRIEEFDNMHSDETPFDIARMVAYGDFNPACPYWWWNGYGNLQSFNEYTVEFEIDKEAIIEDILTNELERSDYYDVLPELREGA